MKKPFLVIVILGWSLNVISQENKASVEQSIFGVQTGILGLWVHNEVKLSNRVAFRSEIGIEAGIGERGESDGAYSDSFIFFAPVISLEPRWYYNLSKRENKSKRIDGNSGNFVSIKTSYHPDLFTINLPDNVIFISDISIVPTWGIRRNIDEHFNYETAIGIGYLHYFKKDNIAILNETDVAINLHLRIGYRF